MRDAHVTEFMWGALVEPLWSPVGPLWDPYGTLVGPSACAKRGKTLNRVPHAYRTQRTCVTLAMRATHAERPRVIVTAHVCDNAHA